MIKHNGVAIFFKEAESFKGEGYEVNGHGGLVFCAESVYGKSFALNADEAIEGAKRQIDNSSSRR